MRDTQKLLLAFALSPLTLPLMWAALAAYWGLSYGEIQMGVGFIYMPAAYIATAVIGVPVFLFYRAVGWENVLLYLAGGVVMGLATGAGLGLWDGEVDSITLALCSAAGVASGLACWLILHRLHAAGLASS